MSLCAELQDIPVLLVSLINVLFHQIFKHADLFCRLENKMYLVLKTIYKLSLPERINFIYT